MASFCALVIIQCTSFLCRTFSRYKMGTLSADVVCALDWPRLFHSHHVSADVCRYTLTHSASFAATPKSATDLDILHICVVLMLVVAY